MKGFKIICEACGSSKIQIKICKPGVEKSGVSFSCRDGKVMIDVEKWNELNK